MNSFFGSNFSIEVHPETINICFVNKHSFHYKCILGFLFDCNTNEFFSITNSRDEFSIFIPKRVALTLQKEFGSNINIEPEDYTCLKIFYTDQIDGVTDTGVVCSISDVFSKHNIPILYVNSFNNNFILIPSYHYSNFVEHFNLIEH
jgi:hypothetical protein